jgi:hypothetical protein
VVGWVALLATRLRSARRQWLLCLGAFATLRLFLLGVGAGADPLLPLRVATVDKAERVFVVRGNLPVGKAALPQAQQEVEGIAPLAPVSQPLAAGAKEVDTRRRVAPISKGSVRLGPGSPTPDPHDSKGSVASAPSNPLLWSP